LTSVSYSASVGSLGVADGVRVALHVVVERFRHAQVLRQLGVGDRVDLERRKLVARRVLDLAQHQAGVAVRLHVEQLDWRQVVSLGVVTILDFCGEVCQ
jgi:hypothetical protein